MRAAILISGYLRTLELNIDSLNKIKKKFKEVDIFLHVTNNEEQEDKYLNHNYDMDFIKEILNPKVIIVENNLNYSTDKYINNLYNTWSKYYKLNNIKRENEKKFGKYDVVIKYRPDLNIISDININVESSLVYIPEDSKIDISKLINKDDKYICDIFAYGDSESMDEYFSIFTSLNILVEKYGYVSETILYHYLKSYNINYKLKSIEYNVILSMCNVFAICGDSGSGKTTLGDILKSHFSNSFMLECDRYHKWERGNENWDKLTHLNPNANYISKMNDDIFDLKVGKTIYQVNYDHSTGRFTEKEKIDKSENIIVCGLHSLYSNNDSVYNIKIFVDTDTNLKIKWKIKRDIEKRGYNIVSILKQIESRKEDYEKYIYPQREKSDVIINFFTDTKFDISNIDDIVNIHLNIFIDKKFTLNDILIELVSNNINFDIDLSDDKFNKLTFKEYKELNNNIVKYRNYYDYIIFIILKLKN